jgi:hypothetical protein
LGIVSAAIGQVLETQWCHTAYGAAGIWHVQEVISVLRNSAASLIIAASIIVAASLNVFVTSAHQAPTALFCVLIIVSALRLSSGAVFVIGIGATAFYFPSARALDIPLDSWQWNVAALIIATSLGVLFAKQRDGSSEKHRDTIKRARLSERERDALRARQSRLRAVLRYAPVFDLCSCSTRIARFATVGWRATSPITAPMT